MSIQKLNVPTNVPNRKMTIGTRVKDSEGNEFVMTGYTFDRQSHELNGVDLRGQGGEITISIHDYQFMQEVIS
jgi:hypothetical protein